MTTQITGTLVPWSETGSEGIWWSIQDNTSTGYDGLHIIKDGDILTVYTEDETGVYWQGIVEYEYKRNWQQFPYNSQGGQQAIHNMWCHGFHHSVSPEFWAEMFFNRKHAVLLKKR